MAIPVMATYWSRQFGEVDHGLVGARGIGLFSYLYHEYVTAIGAACVQGQGPLGTRASAELRCFVLANNLTRGLIPGPFITDVTPDAKDEWHKTVSQAYFAFCKPYAKFPEYLLLGITRRPPVVQCAEQEVWFYRQDARGEPLKKGGPRVLKTTMKLPAVTAGSFEAEDGSVGTILVNTTPLPQQATVKPTDSPAEMIVSLEPFGTRMLIHRRNP